MNQSTISILLSLSFGFPAAFSEEMRNGAPTKTNIAGNKVVVPFEMTRGKPTVQVKINGQGPFTMLFDTGAGATVLNLDLAEELKLPSLGETEIGDPSNPKAIKAQRRKVDSLSIGGAEFAGLEVVAWDRASLYTGTNAPRGVIGFPLFAKCLHSLDYGSNRIIIEGGQLPAANGKDVFDYRINEGGIPEFDIDVAGNKVASHIDSGSMGGVSLSPDFEKKLKFRDQPMVVGKGRTVNSEFEVRAATLDGAVHIGQHVIDQPKVSFSPIIRSANLGSALLKDFVVTFDQANNRVRFVRAVSSGKADGATVETQEQAAPAKDRPRLGLMLAQDKRGGKLILDVRDVVTGMPAEKAGLKSGDRILKINGKTVADMTGEDVSTQMSQPSIKFVVRRGDQELEVEAKLE